MLVTGDDNEAAPSGAAPAATPSASASATASPTQQPTPSVTEEPAQPAPSAAEDLAPFFAAAVTLDQQLQIAAAAINATGPPWERITADVARKVEAADLRPVSRAVPAGLPHDLQQAVILVLSDLTSRRMAMQTFTAVGPILSDDISSDHTNAKLLADLSNGRAAAVRFDGDLAAARELAADTAPMEPVPAKSRLTAEVLILVEYVRVANAGCNARGGAVFTELPEVVWRSVPGMPDAEGTVDIHVPEPTGEATVVHTESTQTSDRTGPGTSTSSSADARHRLPQRLEHELRRRGHRATPPPGR